jgi:NADP-dependent 3-hydroxy acid dehydrogenase YdfG
MKVADKVIAVTGAGNGVGRAVTRQMKSLIPGRSRCADSI